MINKIFIKSGVFLKKFFLLTTSVGLSLVLMEIVLNVVGYKIKEHNWHKEVSQDFKGYDFTGERIYSIDKNLYNDGGFRYNPDHEGIKLDDPNFKKIVVVGDSVTFGVGASDNITYPAILERLLKNKGLKNVLVDNAGVSGYGVDQEFLYLRDDILPKVKPNFIIWAINVNDVYDSNSACLFKRKGNTFSQVPAYYNFLYLQGVADRRWPGFMLESKTYNLFISVMSKFFAGSTGENRFTFGCTIRDMKDEKKVNDLLYTKIEYLLFEANKLSVDSNTKIILTLVPFQSFFNKNISNDDLINFYSKMKKLLSSSKFDFVDMNTEILKKVGDTEFLSYRLDEKPFFTDNKKEWNKLLFMGEEDLTTEGWKHPNNVGYELMAEILSEKINEIK